jgi:hypothetical protein
MRQSPPAFARLLALLGAGLALIATTPVPPETSAKLPVNGEPAEPLAAELSRGLMEGLRLGSDQADRMTMPVEIGGLGPWPFLIDTGSQRSIVATELAQHLALRALPPVKIISIAGPDIVNAVHVGQLRFGSHVVSDLPALSVARAT